MMTHFRILTLAFFAAAAYCADAKTEVAQLSEALNRAALARDADGYLKLLTSDFHSITRTGVVRDRQATLVFLKSGAPPADLKKQELTTSVYGDTVIQFSKETWTANDGTPRAVAVEQVFVKQNGAWKLASRAAVDIAPQNKK